MIKDISSIQLIETNSKHVKSLICNLREDDKRELDNLGLDPFKAIFNCYRQSIWRRTALDNQNNVIAIWGVYGTLFGNHGIPYLMVSNFSSNVSPLLFAKTYREEVGIMKKLFPVLENWVDAEHKQSIRLLKIAGFKLSSPELFGPKNKPFCKFTLESIL